MTHPIVASAVRTGFPAFGLRLPALQAFGIVSSVILAPFLLPADFAIVGARATLASFLQFVVDLGLAGALVQQSEAPDEEALPGAFTFQQAIAWRLVLALWVRAGAALAPALGGPTLAAAVRSTLLAGAVALLARGHKPCGPALMPPIWDPSASPPPRITAGAPRLPGDRRSAALSASLRTAVAKQIAQRRGTAP